MSQIPLFDVNILNEVDSTGRLDGVDLKRVAQCDDGYDYACKRLQDGGAIPLCEWVGHHLWRACGLLTPEFAVLHYSDDSAPAFGSRIELLANQISSNAGVYAIGQFFREHLPVYPYAIP